MRKTLVFLEGTFTILLEEGEEIGWEWGLEMEGLMRARMIESQAKRMQAQALRAIGNTSILEIAHHRMMKHLHVYPDLVLAPRVQIELKQSDATVLPQ